MAVGIVLAALLLFRPAPGHAQAASQQARTVNGRVTETLHGAPVARALVNLNGRAVLTDALGRFSFPAFTDPQGYVRVTKPGFTTPHQRNAAMTRVANLDQPLALELEPDAVLTGVVTGRDGLPLARATVLLARAVPGATGLVMQPVGATTTDSHGAYRFQQPAGRLRVSLRFEPQLAESGLSVLPASLPEGAATSDAGYFALHPGEERRANFLARTGPAYPVAVQIAADAQRGRQGLRVFVQPRDGDAFTTNAGPTGADGQYVVQLPAGSYDLHFLEDSRDVPQEATASLTVTAERRPELALTLVPQTRVPVELAVEAGDPSSKQPVLNVTSILQRLNLSLHLQGSAGALNYLADIRLRQQQGDSFFVAPAGRYRLIQSGAGGGWTVRSAMVGGTSLFDGNLVLGGGSSAQPLRLVVTNATGTASGTVSLPADVSEAWVYVLPRQPQLGTVQPIHLTTEANAALSWSVAVAPGQYLAVAVSEELQEDLQNPTVLAKLAAAGRVVDVADGAAASTQLQVRLTPGGRL